VVEVTEHTRNVLLEVAKSKKIYVEGNFLKILKAPKGDKELEEYLKLCKQKDIETRRKRLEVTKQVQKQNKELTTKQKENDALMEELQSALEEAKNAELEADKLRAEAEKGKDKALEDLETLQKKTQFELVGRIVKIALIIIMGVGVITTLLFAYTLVTGEENPILESTWSNLFGILLTNSFSIVGTIMGVKYATEKD
jgi:regulator of replication initiation timing